jgi:glycosyltransferase involved in cell wall biosynthesis
MKNVHLPPGLGAGPQSALPIHGRVDFHSHGAQIVGQLTEVAADPAALLPPEYLPIEADADGAGFWGSVRVHDLVSSIQGIHLLMALPSGSELSPPLVTVITPCLQSVDTLADTLMGVVRAWEILQQAGEDLEHLVIDGGSTDGTQELLERHASLHPFCRWQRDTGGGPYAAMNVGLQLARGHYCHVLNADDLLLDPGAYADFLIQARQRNAALLLSSIGYFRRPERYLRAEWIVHVPPPDLRVWNKQLRQGLHYPHPGFMAETILYRATGFDERYSLSADYKLMQTLLLRPGLARRVAVFSAPLVAMAEGGATSGWLAILRGKKQLAEINHDLGILAPAWRRYWGKLWLRLARRTHPLPLPNYQGE